MTGARVDSVDAIRDRRIDDFFAEHMSYAIPLTPDQLRDLVKLLFPKIRDFITVDDSKLLQINSDLHNHTRDLEAELLVARNAVENQRVKYKFLVDELRAALKKKKSAKRQKTAQKNALVVKNSSATRIRNPILRSKS